MPQSPGTIFTAEPLHFVVRHQLWDGNVEDHVDQGVSIDVTTDVGGKQTTLLRFNCFDLERSYVYGPENPELTTLAGSAAAWACTAGWTRSPTAIPSAGPSGRWRPSCRRCWTGRLQGHRRGYRPRRGPPRPAGRGSLRERDVLTKRNTVKHNRGTDIFEAGNIRFGLEMRRQKNGDGGLAIHVLGDVGGSKGKAYVEETELLAFDCFWQGAHYHYGPRNKNHRINWDTTLVEDPLVWTFEQLENKKLGAMIERAGYPGVAADLDLDKIASVLPTVKKRAFEMYEEGERLTGHKGLPLEFTPNLAAE